VQALFSTHPGLTHALVRSVEIETFHEAVSLACRAPVETDAAQYSTPFVVSAVLVHGRLTAAELAGAGLNDARVLELSRTMSLVESAEFSARFPAERWARVRLTLNDGTVLDSGAHTPRGDPDTPLSDQAISAKFRANSEPAVGEATAKRIEQTIQSADSPLSAFLDVVLTPTRLDAAAVTQRRDSPGS